MLILWNVNGTTRKQVARPWMGLSLWSCRHQTHHGEYLLEFHSLYKTPLNLCFQTLGTETGLLRALCLIGYIDWKRSTMSI